MTRNTCFLKMISSSQNYQKKILGIHDALYSCVYSMDTLLVKVVKHFWWTVGSSLTISLHNFPLISTITFLSILVLGALGRSANTIFLPMLASIAPVMNTASTTTINKKPSPLVIYLYYDDKSIQVQDWTDLCFFSFERSDLVYSSFVNQVVFLG